MLHDERHGYPYAEGSADALYHDECGLLYAVVVAYEAEQEAGEQTVYGVGFQVVPRIEHRFAVARENACKEVSAEKCQQEHDKSEYKGDCDACFKCLLCAVCLACTVILRHKCGHGLHERRRYQHDEGAYLFRNAYACRGGESYLVDNGEHYKEGDSHKEVLKGYGSSYAEYSLCTGAVHAYVRPVELKWQLCAAYDDKGYENAYELSENCCKSRSVCTEPQHCHEEKVADYIEHAGYAHGDEGRLGVAETAENASQQVVRGDDEKSAAAYAYVACGDVKSLLGSVHYLRQKLCAEDADDREQQSRKGEDDKSRADGLSRVLWTPLTYFLPHGYGYAHGKAYKDIGKGHYYL